MRSQGKSSFHKDRVEKIITRELGIILSSEVKDDRLRFVTITKVDLTNDLSIATCFYTVLGNDEQKVSTSKNLNDAKGFIKSILSQRLDIRKIPNLIFKYDNSLEYGAKMDKIFNDINKK